MALDLALRALNRFGLGARAGERSGISDPRGWLRAQLQGAPPALPPAPGAAPGDVAEAMRDSRIRTASDGERGREARRRLVRVAAEESRAALAQRITTDRPLVERLVAFWSNHLCVSAARRVVAPLAGSYEREVVRPHVLGRFEEMVLASARHPAMLLYLDNARSIGPGSPAARGARRAAAGRGLNENYARELLELHTLGVNGGYSQADVLALARILTGWTVAGVYGPGAPGRDAGPIRFVFRDRLHEPGTKSLLGVPYADGGAAEGERAVRALCRHPSTAAYVARKLVVHFVADQPPAAAVERVARTFRESEGDLRAVAQALVDLPEAWAEDTRKFRSPQDWLVAVLRAFGAPGAGPNLAAALRQLRHPLWAPAAANGFGDTTDEWADPDALLNRAELARTLASGAAGRGVDPGVLLDVVEAGQAGALRTLLADRSIPPAERTALAIGGPAFQWR